MAFLFNNCIPETHFFFVHQFRFVGATTCRTCTRLVLPFVHEEEARQQPGGFGRPCEGRVCSAKPAAHQQPLRRVSEQKRVTAMLWMNTLVIINYTLYVHVLHVLHVLHVCTCTLYNHFLVPFF